MLYDQMPLLYFAKKYNIKESEIEVILRSQFEFLKTEITSENFNNIKLKHLGKFIVNEKRKEKFYKYKTNSYRMGESNIREIGNTQNRITEDSTKEKKDM